MTSHFPSRFEFEARHNQDIDLPEYSSHFSFCSVKSQQSIHINMVILLGYWHRKGLVVSCACSHPAGADPPPRCSPQLQASGSWQRRSPQISPVIHNSYEREQ